MTQPMGTRDQTINVIVSKGSERDLSEKPASRFSHPSLSQAINPEGRCALFLHPEDVLNDAHLAPEDKRAILAAWASDARGVPDAPALRRLDSGAIVDLDDILDALKQLDDPRDPSSDGSEQPSRACGQQRGFSRNRPFSSPVRARLGRAHPRDPDDDDPPPPPAMASLAHKNAAGMAGGGI